MHQDTNPLLSKLKLPGRTFQLPSRGIFYKNGELAPGIEDGELHVYPLSAMTEITLKNPDLLFSGEAIDKVIAECVPGILKPRELFARDIDAIFFYLRLVTYGSDFQVEVKHTCEHAKSHSYTVNIEKLVMEAKQLDPTLISSRYTVNLPNGQVVRLKPIRYFHMLNVLQLNANKTEFSPEDVKANLRMSLMELIEDIDGVTDRKQIEEWVMSVSSPLLNRLSGAMQGTNDWGVRSDTEIRCLDCGQTMQVQLPVDPVSFFTE
jgi:hypothetical protein